MRSIFLLPVLLVGSFAPAAAAQGCVISGVTTLDFGQGCGFGSPPQMKIGYDAGSCALEVDITAFGCCNYFPAGHILTLGQELRAPVSLPSPPFMAGCLQLISMRERTAEQPGLSSRYGVPQSPSLIGRTIDFQAAVRWFDTISFISDYGVTQGVHVTFY
ncbi:MAG: hypothetical protein EYC70_08825 [Planctomycetota bacterium]|nr:MAG: hypothetical protein EYC70_08825 [Planctomycetota bacterium]